MSADRREDASFEATVRRAFARLTGEDLPRVAAARGWPVRTPEEFERLLLDRAPGAGAGAPCLVDLVLAIELGEQLIAGKLCCVRMSQRLRGNAAALARLRELLAQPKLH